MKNLTDHKKNSLHINTKIYKQVVKGITLDTYSQILSKSVQIFLAKKQQEVIWMTQPTGHEITFTGNGKFFLYIPGAMCEMFFINLALINDL